jgi:Tfp pilus assembly protein PilZ
MTQDQRRDKRIVTRQKLWREGQDATAETRDVSHNGMFIVSEDAPEVGEQLKVTFNVAEGEEATLNLEVMWRGAKDAENKTGIGVRIVGFDKGREAYEKFISRHVRNDSKSPQPTLRPTAPPRPSQGPKSET